MPPTKKPNRPMAPSPAPTVNLPAAPEDVAAGDADVLEAAAAEVRLAEVALALALTLASLRPEVAVLPPVDLAVPLLVADAVVSAASPTLPPNGFVSSSMLSSPSVSWAAVLYALRVLSLGLPGGQWLVRREIMASCPDAWLRAPPCIRERDGWDRLTRSRPRLGHFCNALAGCNRAKSGRLS